MPARFLILLASAAVSSSATAQQPEFIGQTRWIKESYLGVKLCDRAAGVLEAKCKYVKSGKLRVVDAAPGISAGSYRYLVSLADGSSGFMQDVDLRYQTTAKDPAIAVADCERRGQPAIGMTSSQATASCWGKPSHINRTETGAAKLDQYVYSGNRYLYLRDGIVESIQTTGQLR